MSLICVRHGESTANAGAATTDPLGIRLTELGRLQAQQIAASWSRAPALIVTSPATRAQATAAPTIDRFPGVPVESWPIEEFTYLSPTRCAGTTVVDRRRWVAEYWNRGDPQFIDGEGAESFEQFIVRVKDATRKFADRADHRRADILVFGHGQFINAMRWSRGAANPLDMNTFRSFDLTNPIANCQRVEL
ncbi:histidine phosphatase family protein [Roseateles sp. LYH14W]|uniref:Histidine phosphatase family protein n=1 Tax=Pelomonas parva TaxID=3299032 RepID=A0ABW7F8C2_9BURK